MKVPVLHKYLPLLLCSLLLLAFVGLSDGLAQSKEVPIEQIQQELEQEKGLEKIILNVSVILLFILLFLVLIVLFQKRQTSLKFKKQNELIRQQARELTKVNQEFLKQNLRLETVLHEKNSIVSIISNDLKKPLNRITALSDLIRLDGGKQLNKNQLEYLDMMKQVVQDGLAVIQNLLDSRVIEDYKKEINIERIDLHEILLDIIKRYQRYAATKHIQLFFKSNVAELEYRTDEFFIRRIVDNLISNAIKFSLPNKKVFVNLLDFKEKVRLEIKDEGIGICQEDMAKLFQKHQQYKNRPTAGEISAGLGLSIVKTLTEELNGMIWCESREGKGSLFVVEFPKIIIER